MNKKLTLRLDQKIIERAKKYARENNTSLSKMIESYFESLTNTKVESAKEFTPLVKSLVGVISLPKDYDYKSDRADHLMDKHQ